MNLLPLCCGRCSKPIGASDYIRDVNQGEDFHPKCFSAWVETMPRYETSLIFIAANGDRGGLAPFSLGASSPHLASPEDMTAKEAP